MNADELRAKMEQYLEIRRAVGFSSHDYVALLPKFIEFILKKDNVAKIQSLDCVEWATMGGRCTKTSSRKLSVVRNFLKFLKASWPDTEIPSMGIVGTYRRPQPYIFKDNEVIALINMAKSLRPKRALRPHTLSTLFGFLACTGIRIGEARALKINDVDLKNDPPNILVTNSKFNKSRVVPLHKSTAFRLSEFIAMRRELGYDVTSDILFVSEKANKLDLSSTLRLLNRLCKLLNIRPQNGQNKPTLHSFRHTFAVNRLVRWNDEGKNIQECLPSLSVYLGHLSPKETYWYLSATEHVLNRASQVFEEHFFEGGVNAAT